MTLKRITLRIFSMVTLKTRVSTFHIRVSKSYILQRNWLTRLLTWRTTFAQKLTSCERRLWSRFTKTRRRGSRRTRSAMFYPSRKCSISRSWGKSSWTQLLGPHLQFLLSAKSTRKIRRAPRRKLRRRKSLLWTLFSSRFGINAVHKSWMSSTLMSRVSSKRIRPSARHI